MENAPPTIVDRYLKEAGLSLSAFATEMDRAPSTLFRALNGERTPSARLALDIERATKGRIKADEFMRICLSAFAKREKAQ